MRAKQNHRSLVRHWLLASAATLLVAAQAHAQGARHKFDIPEGDAATALREFARQSGTQVLFPYDAPAASKHTPAIKGDLDDLSVLTEIAKDAGFVILSNDGRTVTLGVAPAADPEVKTSTPQVAEVTITGSRVVRSGVNSPTPVTVVTLGALEANTPSDVPDALNKLPVFDASRSQRTTGGSTINWPGNFLNLREIGSNRTLILVDGMRVSPTDQSGDVDANILPQSLLERVDIVTGGASAVYGSDAVAGVVNFVINKKFNGLEISGQGGVSNIGDDASRRITITAGTPVLDGRGHIEGSFDWYDSDGVDNYFTRPLGSAIYQEVGGGSASNPYHLISDVRNLNDTPGGYIASGPLANMTFAQNGVLSPFQHGAPITGVLEQGGQGGYIGESYYHYPGADAQPWLTASLATERLFGRFDYDFGAGIHGFVEANLTNAENYSVSGMQQFTATYAADNAFLPTSAATLLSQADASSFTMAKAIMDRHGAVSDGQTTGIQIFAGLNGKFADRFNWEIHYSHGSSELHEISPDQLNIQRLYASLDAVVNPANNQIVCRVSLTSSASMYPGCVPFNAFGPNAESTAAWKYVTDTTDYRVDNGMDDVSGSVSGDLFNDWAGPVRVAVSGEWRNMSLGVSSAYPPTLKVNCAGLNPLTCNPNVAVWNGVVANMPTKQESVSEGAIEAEIPLVKDLPFIKSFTVNTAARYTDYSISGPATTWKLGAIWQVVDDLRFRLTQSRDIRAPNLNDLYAPVNANISAFTDYLTGVSNNTTVESSGNPDLKPEVADTMSIGLVYQPHWLHGFSTTVDWYKIKIDHVITSISGGNASVEQICIASGGTSVYCSLVTRPYPITNTTAANFPTVVRSEPENSGYLVTDGIDAEADYTFKLSDIRPSAPGRLTARLLFSFQPDYKSFTGIPGAAVLNAAGAEGSVFSLPDKRATLNLTYDVGPLDIAIQERWHAPEVHDPNRTFVYLQGSVPQYFVTDFSTRYKFVLHGVKTEAFLSIENLFDTPPALFISTSRTGAPGYAYPASFDEDVIGRYFTVGLKAKL
jgi:outer membrane receptor protein involved in Fe transport